jgi:hypothetical protein
MQKGPDQQLYVLAPTGWQANGLFRVDTGADRLVAIHPGMAGAAAFTLDAQGQVYYVGSFGKPGQKPQAIARYRLAEGAAGQAGYLPANGDLGGGENLVTRGILARPDGSLITRVVTTSPDGAQWPRLRLERFAADGTRTGFFDVQEHYGWPAHQHLYAVVKAFHPSALIYHLEPYSDGGVLLVIEALNTVFRLSAEGKVLWAAGARPEAGGDTAPFSSPRDVAVDRRGNIWVVDAGNSNLVCLSPEGKVRGSYGHLVDADSRDGSGFNQPIAIETVRSVDGAEYLYVGDSGNARYAKYRIDE